MDVAAVTTGTADLLRRFDAVTAATFEQRATGGAVRAELGAIASEGSAARSALGPLAPDGVEHLLAAPADQLDRFATRAETGAMPHSGNADVEHVWRLRAGLASMHAAASAAAQLGVEATSPTAAGGLQAIDGAAHLVAANLLADGAQQLAEADRVLGTFRMPGFMREGHREAFLDTQKATVRDRAVGLIAGVQGELGHLLPEADRSTLTDAMSTVRNSFMYAGDVGNGDREEVLATMRRFTIAAHDRIASTDASTLEAVAGSAARNLGGSVRQGAARIAKEFADPAHLDGVRAVLADPHATPAATAAAMRDAIATAAELDVAAGALTSGLTDAGVIDVARRARGVALQLTYDVQASPAAIVLPEATHELLASARAANGVGWASSRIALLPAAFAHVDQALAAGPPRMVADVLALAGRADEELAASAKSVASFSSRVPVAELGARVDAVDGVVRQFEDSFWQVERVRGQQLRPGVHASISLTQAARLRTELARQVSATAETLLPADAWRLPADTLGDAFATRSSLRELAVALAPSGSDALRPAFTDTGVDAIARAAGRVEQLRARLATPGAVDLLPLDSRTSTAMSAITDALDHLQQAAVTGSDWRSVGAAIPDYEAGLAKAQAAVEQLDGVVPPEFLQPIAARIQAFATQVQAASNAVGPGYGRVLGEALYPRRASAAFIESDLKVLNQVLAQAGPESI